MALRVDPEEVILVFSSPFWIPAHLWLSLPGFHSIVVDNGQVYRYLVNVDIQNRLAGKLYAVAMFFETWRIFWIQVQLGNYPMACLVLYENFGLTSTHVVNSILFLLATGTGLLATGLASYEGNPVLFTCIGLYAFFGTIAVAVRWVILANLILRNNLFERMAAETRIIHDSMAQHLHHQYHILEDSIKEMVDAAVRDINWNVASTVENAILDNVGNIVDMCLARQTRTLRTFIHCSFTQLELMIEGKFADLDSLIMTMMSGLGDDMKSLMERLEYIMNNLDVSLAETGRILSIAQGILSNAGNCVALLQELKLFIKDSSVDSDAAWMQVNDTLKQNFDKLQMDVHDLWKGWYSLNRSLGDGWGDHTLFSFEQFKDTIGKDVSELVNCVLALQEMATEFKRWQEKQTRMLKSIRNHRQLDSSNVRQMFDDIASSLEISTEQILARVREESRETQDIVASGHIQLEDKVESTLRNSVPSLTSSSTNSLGLTGFEDGSWPFLGRILW
ncbi:hypothetical protein FRC03_007341 [Tulasnella sp. 419]|nr:hypothetical protein FRC03_007341 [Tulasnella sp. 419]